jgi:pseudouridine synthase
VARSGVRLNKILSGAGVASRRTADQLIRQGRVTVNGRVADALGTRADPAHDDIRVDGRRLRAAPERRYLLMYKPRQVVSTRSDPQRRTTVLDLLARAGIHGYFYPVGRLDYDSEGLLILTNDGEFAERVTHPRYELERTYDVEVEGVPDERDLERLRRGVDLDGRRTKPAQARLLRVAGGKGGRRAVLELILREGRQRQVRRMCDAIAHPVARLRRTRIGPVSDPRLRPGGVRDLTPAERRALTAAPASPRSRT